MLARIQDKLARAADRLGRLNPTLSESELTAFERDFRVTLPDEYRAFLLRVGDGGPGPGDGLGTLAQSARQSPTADLDRPFPFSSRAYAEGSAQFRGDLKTLSAAEAGARELERHGGVPWRERPDRKYAQPGVLFLATPDSPWADAYLVVTGEDRGKVWMYGFECGWDPEAPTWAEDEGQIDKPPRGFLRWYEDWRDHALTT